MADIEVTLAEALAHVEAERRTTRIRNFCRSASYSEERTNEQGEIDLLKRIQEKARRPDLRRAQGL